jgi:hypothetical protein
MNDSLDESRPFSGSSRRNRRGRNGAWQKCRCRRPARREIQLRWFCASICDAVCYLSGTENPLLIVDYEHNGQFRCTGEFHRPPTHRLSGSRHQACKPLRVVACDI